MKMQVATLVRHKLASASYDPFTSPGGEITFAMSGWAEWARRYLDENGIHAPTLGSRKNTVRIEDNTAFENFIIKKNLHLPLKREAAKHLRVYDYAKNHATDKRVKPDSAEFALMTKICKQGYLSNFPAGFFSVNYGRPLTPGDVEERDAVFRDKPYRIMQWADQKDGFHVRRSDYSWGKNKEGSLPGGEIFAAEFFDFIFDEKTQSTFDRLLELQRNNLQHITDKPVRWGTAR